MNGLRTMVAGLVALASAGVTFGCGGGDGTNVESGFPSVTSSRDGVAAVPSGDVPSRTEVHVAGLDFRPARVKVGVADTVVWINEDIVPHTVTGEEDEWRSGELEVADEYRWVAPRPGVYRYSCEYHPTMVGVLEVR